MSARLEVGDRLPGRLDAVAYGYALLAQGLRPMLALQATLTTLREQFSLAWTAAHSTPADC